MNSTHIGDPIRLCSRRYPIIGEPPSYGRSHFMTIASPDPSKTTCIGLPGGEGGSKKQSMESEINVSEQSANGVM